MPDRFVSHASATEGDLRWLGSRLECFYARSGRDLPWRSASLNPCLLLNTEVLLQRTRAEDVAKNWQWIADNLASPDSTLESGVQLSRLCRSLGLAKRAEWILAIAAQVLQLGMLPNALDELLSLPGVGQYCARATLAFSYGSNQGLVDCNVARVLERFIGSSRHADPRQQVKHWLPISEQIARAGDHRSIFWGMIDLAALVCTRRVPRCADCSLASHCAFASESA